jgi:hypothetical protein
MQPLSLVHPAPVDDRVTGTFYPYAHVKALEARIAALEDCLQELAPFAECSKIDMRAHFEAESPEIAEAKGIMFKRDTLYLDQRIFRKVAKLLRQKRA